MASPSLALSAASAAGRPRYATAITPLHAGSSWAPRSITGAVSAAATSTASSVVGGGVICASDAAGSTSSCSSYGGSSRLVTRCALAHSKSVYRSGSLLVRRVQMEASRPEDSKSKTTETVEVEIDELKRVISAALQGKEGHSVDHANIIADVLIYAETQENSQGLHKLLSGALAKTPKSDTGKHVNERSGRRCDSTFVVDGAKSDPDDVDNSLPGMVAMHEACERSIGIARTQGIAVVGTNNTSSSTGALGYWVDKVAREGFVAIVMSQSPELVAPFGSREAILGTNPLAVGVPINSADGIPWVVDMATSAMALFQAVKSTNLPAGVAVNSEDGTDIADGSRLANALTGGGKAALLPWGGHKGAALGLIIEILAGALCGGEVRSNKVQARNWGNLIITIDPEALGQPLQEFKSSVSILLNRIRNSPAREPFGEVRIPGDRSSMMQSEAQRTGRLNVSRAIWDELVKLGIHVKNYATASKQGNASRSFAVCSVTTTAPRLHPSTRILHGPKMKEDAFLSSAPPLYQTATFAQPSVEEFGPYDYTRSGNPTRDLLQDQLAVLEVEDPGNQVYAYAYTSGMAAITASLRLVPANGSVLAGNDIYGGTSRWLEHLAPRAGINVVHVDLSDIDATKAVLQDAAKDGRKFDMMILETPTNPRLQVSDIEQLSRLGHESNSDCIVLVDNSIMTALYQRPLDLGADIAMCSATKFAGGHGDATGGILAVKTQELSQRLYFQQNAEGSGLAPFESWLLLRGVKTMALRMERSVENAIAIAKFLAKHPLVKRVNFPYPLQAHANCALTQLEETEMHLKQSNGCPGSILSFETGDVASSRKICAEVELFRITVSFGSCNSLISLPCLMSHASIPPEIRAARGLPEDLVRISAGIEHSDDLIQDLARVMDSIYNMKHTSSEASS